MSRKFQTDRRVEFRDTDAAGIMHFSVFFNYMEQVEHEFWRSLGLSVMMPGDTDDYHVSWPRVSASCDYVAPAHFEDVLDIALSVASIGKKSVRYRFEFRRGRTLVATGSLVGVCCRVAVGSPPESMHIPESIQQVLLPYLDDFDPPIRP